MSKKKSNNSTKQRLLQQAGVAFAEKGFHAAGIREICDKAGANVSAVNYYFGDKEKLYEAVIKHAFDYALEKYPLLGKASEDASPEELLYEFILSLLSRRLDANRPAWHRTLLWREIDDPSSACREILKNIKNIHYQKLLNIMKKMVSPELDDDCIHFCMASIVGQVMFYQREKFDVGPMDRFVDYSPEGLETLARHICNFSISAVRNMYAGNGADKKNKSKNDGTSRRTNRKKAGKTRKA